MINFLLKLAGEVLLYWFVPVLSVSWQMQMTFFSLDPIPCQSHEIDSEYLITWPWRCLPYAIFKNESDLDLQDQIIKIMFFANRYFVILFANSLKN